MSDADDQMGGTEPPGKTGQERPEKTSEESEQDEEADEASKESFPASDPPANY